MKKIFFTFLLIIPILFIGSCEEDEIHGCLDSQALNYNSEATIDNNSCEYPGIGSLYEGGIIFYIDETGVHGLVAAMEDLQETYEWGCYSQIVNGADGTEIGAGYQNTLDIVSHGCATINGAISAAQVALNTEINGYSDWYLPSKYELIEMYNTIGNGGPEGNIGGFQSERYWSSSEFDNDYDFAWFIDFYNGYTSFERKGERIRVRPIRSF